MQYAYQLSTGTSHTDILKKFSLEITIDFNVVDFSIKLLKCVHVIYPNTVPEILCLIGNKYCICENRIIIYKYYTKYYLVNSDDGIIMGNIINNHLNLFRNWSNNELISWSNSSNCPLASLLKIYSKVLTDSKITGDKLLSASEEDFLNLGIISLAYRRIMIQETRKIAAAIDFFQDKSLDFTLKIQELLKYYANVIGFQHLINDINNINILIINGDHIILIDRLINVMEECKFSNDYQKLSIDLPKIISRMNNLNSQLVKIINVLVDECLRICNAVQVLQSEFNLSSNSRKAPKISKDSYTTSPHNLLKDSISHTEKILDKIIESTTGYLNEYLLWVKFHLDPNMTVKSIRHRTIISRNVLTCDVSSVRYIEKYLFLTRSTKKKLVPPEPAKAKNAKTLIKHHINLRTEEGKYLIECFDITCATLYSIKNNFHTNVVTILETSSSEDSLIIRVSGYGKLNYSNEEYSGCKLIKTLYTGMYVSNPMILSGNPVTIHIITSEQFYVIVKDDVVIRKVKMIITL